MAWFRRLRGTLFDSRIHDGFDEEARFHLEQRTEEAVRRGLPRDEARRDARRRFGNMTLAREQAGDADTLRWLQHMREDLRFAARMARRHPAFSVVVTVTLALGIAASTVMFSVVYGVLLRPLPYPDSQRLVRLSEYHEGANSPLREAVISDLAFDAWRRSTRTLDGLAAYSERAYTVTGVGDAERVRATAASPGLFGLLGASPAIGRFFDPAEAFSGADRVVVLSYGYWQRRFGGRAEAVGQTVSLDGRSCVIVGVAPPGFSFPDADRQLFTPYVLRQQPDRIDATRPISVFSAIARLAPGTTTARAEAEGTAIVRALSPRPIASDLVFGKGGAAAIRVQTIVGEATSTVRPMLLLLAVAVGLLLLISCVNVANLFLSHGVARERELAVRAALGAGRGRLLGQLLTESLAFSIGGGLLGVLLAWSAVRMLPLAAPAAFPRLSDIHLDRPTLLFAIGISMLTGVVAGLAPAVHSTQRLAAISREGAGVSGSLRRLRTHRGLLAIEAASALVLLVSALLLARSFARLARADVGYDAENVLTARIFIPGERATTERWGQLARATVERLQAVPGVAAVGASSMAPLGDSTLVIGFQLERDRQEPVIARALGYVITPGYARAMRLRLRQGRLLTDADIGATTQALVVNQRFVDMYLADGRAVVGRRYSGLLGSDVVSEIVGVVGNVAKNGVTEAPQPELYVALGAQGMVSTGHEIYLVIRSSGDRRLLGRMIRTIVRDIDPDAPVHNIGALSDELSASVAEPRFASTVLGALTALALTLAAIGLYGVLSYDVSRRQLELGIRTALGATPADLVGIVVRQGMSVTGVGLLAGLAVAVAVTRLMRSMLFGVAPLDPVSFIAAPLLLILVASAACAVPAVRAGSIDPVEALRCD